MWSSLTVTYVALTVVAAVLVVAGAVAGVRLAWRWPQGPPGGEERDVFDRRHHLVVTLLWVGTLSAIVLSPLWFWALSSLVPAVEGGMCMASVHELGRPDSWLASAMKVALPALLLYWLAVDRADRRAGDEPLLAHKLSLLVPVALAVVVATTFDLRFFLGLTLGPSPCCMTLFDQPAFAAEAGPTGWGWTYAYGASVALLGAATPLHRGAVRAGLIALAVAAAVALIAALHTGLGSAIMDRPHHCIFCVFSEKPLSFAATALVMAGLWLLIARAGLSLALSNADRPSALRPWLPLGLVLAGTATLGALAL